MREEQNTLKEDAMRDQLKAANSRFQPRFGIELPNSATELDFLLVDEEAETLILAELKWLRKPGKPLERLAREADLEKGIAQLKLIRDYAAANPDWLQKRGFTKKPLRDYAHVHYLLIVRDYWHWIEPDTSIAVVDFEEFCERYSVSGDLHTLTDALLSYDWLPVEGRDFYVRYKGQPLYGVVLESPEFMVGKAPPPQ